MDDAQSQQVSLICEKCGLPFLWKSKAGAMQKFCKRLKCIRQRQKDARPAVRVLYVKSEKGNPCTYPGCTDFTGVNKWFCKKHHEIVTDFYNDVSEEHDVHHGHVSNHTKSDPG